MLYWAGLARAVIQKLTALGNCPPAETHCKQAVRLKENMLWKCLRKTNTVSVPDQLPPEEPSRKGLAGAVRGTLARRCVWSSAPARGPGLTDSGSSAFWNPLLGHTGVWHPGGQDLGHLHPDSWREEVPQKHHCACHKPSEVLGQTRVGENWVHVKCSESVHIDLH